jgi:hypothetical protein
MIWFYRMNRQAFSIFVLVVFAGAHSLGAQAISPQCPPGGFKSNGDPDNTKIAQDACQKAIDLFQYVAPQLGAVLAGANATQGLTGTLGGLGHFSVGIRGNIIEASLPEVDRVVPATHGAEQSSYTLSNRLIGLPTGDIAIGLFNGLPLGLSHAGGIDLLLNASYLTSYNNGSVDVAVSSSWKLGYGVKIGILQEGLLVPGISLSILTRALPVVTIVGSSGQDRLALDSIRVNARSWRLVAGKSVLFFGGAVGVGGDTYTSDATLNVTIAPRPATEGGSAGPIFLTQKLTRSNIFASAWINVLVVRIVGELGRVSGGDIATYNQFSGTQPADPRSYGSIGLSFGW